MPFPDLVCILPLFCADKMKKRQAISILKSSGELVPFDENKLHRSLTRAGSDKVLANRIIREISAQLYEGMPTGEIYRKAFAMLRSFARPMAAKYRLKTAIMELGPTGFPFEKYVAALLQSQGFETITNQVLEGRCVTHEVDVLATVNDNIHFIECKFHNLRGLVCDVKVPLYIHSRFLDLKEKQSLLKENKGKTFKGWVVTNTSFSEDAIKYGLCSGLELMGWDFPAGQSLRELIDTTGLHPITCLTALTQREKKLLLEDKVVLCHDLLKDPSILDKIGVKSNRRKTVLAEAKTLCQMD